MINFIVDLVNELKEARGDFPVLPSVYEPVYWPGQPPVELGPPPTFPGIEVAGDVCIEFVGVPGVHYLVP